MDYTKSATIIQTEFIAEWNNLLGVLDKILLSISNTNRTRVFILLFNKINSNCHAAINLIDQGFINEGLMIFRSAIETVIYAKYLKLYPEKQKEFLDLSDLFLIKNHFIQYKQMKKHKSRLSPDIQYLLQTIEDNIRQLLNTNEHLRQLFPSLIINFDEKDIRTLDKFFQDPKLKFTSQRVSHLLKKIEEREPAFANTSLNLHDIYYAYYDENSAILHGNYLYWNKQPTLDQYNLLRISSHLIRISANIDDLLKEYISKNLNKNLELKVKKLIDLESKLDLFSTSFPDSQNYFPSRLNSSVRAESYYVDSYIPKYPPQCAEKDNTNSNT